MSEHSVDRPDLVVDPVFETVRRVISTVAKIPTEEIRADNPVTGLANVDSIILLEVVAHCELEFGIEISAEDLFDAVTTVGDFVEVCRRLKKTVAA